VTGAPAGPRPPASGPPPVPFGARLAAAVAATGPLCLGIDPSAALLDAWGLPDDPSGLRRFALRCVEAVAGVLPAVKPQVAFFERHGAAGYAALEEVLAACRGAGLLAVADAKRGDIDSTAAAYGDAWVGSGPLAADAVTVHPYLGLDALRPLLDTAWATGRGVFVVVRSSNAEGRSVQEAVGSSGDTVADALLRQVAALNAARSEHPGSVGAVVGATLEPSAFPLASLGGPILAPGVGAQGATASDVAVRFAGCAAGTVLPSASRSVLAAGPSAAALRRAAASLRDEIAAGWA